MTLKRYTRYTTASVLAVTMAVSLWVWWPTRVLPFHWDSADYVIGAAIKLMETDYQPLVARGSDFAHPPLLSLLVASAWDTFGHSLLAAHILMFPFYPLLIVGTYMLGRRLASWQVGIAAAGIAATSPVLVAEYGQVYIDLPAAALVVWTAWLWLSQRRYAAAITLTLACLFKETALFILPALVWWSPVGNSLSSRTSPREQDWQRLLPLALPVLVLALWFKYHQATTGWMFVEPSRPTVVPGSFSELMQSIWFVVGLLLINQRWWLMVLPASVAIWHIKRQGYWEKQQWWTWIGLMTAAIVPILIFGMMGEFGERYALIVLPFACLASLLPAQTVLQELVSDQWQSYLLLGAVLVAGVWYSRWHPESEEQYVYDFRPSANLSYTDVIGIGQAAAKVLASEHASAQVFGSFPESYQLTQPWQGYVSEPLQFFECSDFVYDSEVEQVLYVHPYSRGQQACRLLLDTYETTPIQRFSLNGKWLELYHIGVPLEHDILDTLDTRLVPLQY